MAEQADTLGTQLMLLTRPVVYLRRIKVKDPLVRRFNETWHKDTLQPHWAATIGLWGGVATHETIIERAKVNYNVFKVFRSRNALSSRYGSFGHLRPQHDLALSAYLRWKSEVHEAPTPENVGMVASHFGILPIELRIYVDRVELLLAELGIEPAALLTKGSYDIVAPQWAKHSEDIDAHVTSTYSHVDV